MSPRKSYEFFVDQGDSLSATYLQTLYTYGLATCTAITAYGSPGPRGVNKVMAHFTAGSESPVMENFISLVRSSGMTGYKVCLSQPDYTYNDHSITDDQIKTALRDNNVPEHEITPQRVNNFRNGFRQIFIDSRRTVAQLCQGGLGIVPAAHTRDLTAEGTMEASLSPGGMVTADGRLLDYIPDPQTTSTGQSSHGSQMKPPGGSAGGSSGGFSGGSTSRTGFASGPVGGFSGSSAGGSGGGYQTSHHGGHGTNYARGSAGGNSKSSKTGSGSKNNASHGSSSKYNTGYSSSSKHSTSHGSKQNVGHSSSSKQDPGYGSSSSKKLTSGHSSSHKSSSKTGHYR